jgi:uncharacterized RDD family membrane protein YckC
MSTISITTSQNIELDYDLGSLGDRILARLIDLAVIIAYVIIIFVTIGFSNLGTFIVENVWLVVVLMLPAVFYNLVCELVLNGQSLGKKIMGIKVISLSGEQPSLSQYLIRWLFRIVDFSFGGLVALIIVAVTPKHQRLGDILAGTAVVKTKPRTHFADTIYTATPTIEYQVIYPEVVNLKDGDIQLVKDVVISVYKSQNLMLAHQAKDRIEQVLGIRSQHAEPMDFLRTVLADYNYLTSSM